jgi:hypothetical protein
MYDVVLSTYYVLCVIDCTAFVIMHREPNNSCYHSLTVLTVNVWYFHKGKTVL